MQLWGVTYTVILERIAHGPTDDDPDVEPSPSTDTITDYIQEFAGEINVAIAVSGQDPDSITSTSDPNRYYQVRGYLIRRVVAQWRWDNNLNVPIATFDGASYADWLKKLEEKPQLGGSETGTSQVPVAVAEDRPRTSTGRYLDRCWEFG